MARKITTLDGLRSELMKLVGKQGSVAVGTHRYLSYEPGSRYESEGWDASVSIKDTEGFEVVSATVTAQTASDIILKMRVKIRDELEAMARRRKLDRSARRVEGQPQKRLEYSGGVQ